MRGVKESTPPCRVENCPEYSHAKEYCSKHYARVVRRNYTDPDTRNARLSGVEDEQWFKRAMQYIAESKEVS
jgi:hypothetical protein